MRDVSGPRNVVEWNMGDLAGEKGCLLMWGFVGCQSTDRRSKSMLVPPGTRPTQRFLSPSSFRMPCLVAKRTPNVGFPCAAGWTQLVVMCSDLDRLYISGMP